MSIELVYLMSFGTCVYTGFTTVFFFFKFLHRDGTELAVFLIEPKK